MASFPVRNSGFARWLVAQGEVVVPIPHVGVFQSCGVAPFRLVMACGQRAARKRWEALFWGFFRGAGPNRSKCDCCGYIVLTGRSGDERRAWARAVAQEVEPGTPTHKMVSAILCEIVERGAYPMKGHVREALAKVRAWATDPGASLDEAVSASTAARSVASEGDAGRAVKALGEFAIRRTAAAAEATVLYSGRSHEHRL